MNKENAPLELTMDWVRTKTEDLATPIDFEALEKEGLLKKEGSWYRTKNLQELPEHVLSKIEEVQTDQKGVLVRLKSEKPYQKLLRKFR